MPWISTEDLTPQSISRFTLSQNNQVYNGLDCCLTYEVRQEIGRQFNSPPAIYSFERALQAPYLEIMQRGFLVDNLSRQKAALDLRGRINALQIQLNEFAQACWGKGVNPRSPVQLKDLFYNSMRFPEIWMSQKGVRKLAMNRETLEKLDEQYLYARPLIGCILRIRELAKQVEVLETEIDPDGRMRTSYNIAGTECISGDSLLWTKGGLRRIDEIYATPHSVAVWNGMDFITPVRKVCYKNRAGFSIELEGGYSLKCSQNHPVFTQRGFVEAKDLTLADKIQLNIGLPELFGQHAMPRESVFSQMSEDLCELVGMIIADGSLNCNSEHYRCRLANSDSFVLARFIELVKKCCSLTAGRSGDEAYFSSKNVCLWLQQFGIPADSGLGTAKIKQISPEILRGKPNLLRALLRGITLDSHITEKGLMYGTQSPVLREQLQQILLVLGIATVKIQVGEGIKLCVPRRYCGRFISMIGFVQDSKLKKLSRLLNERSQWHEPLVFSSKPFGQIKSITPWTGDVYDLTMPESSPAQYVAQGMTVHNTGRPSSSQNAFGSGGNLQNIPPSLRYAFIADKGYKLCVIDLEQVEARDVGFFMGCLFDDWTFLDSCEGGDLHTNNARLIWPELPWTGDKKSDRAIADQIFYRDFSYRDMAKRGSHLSNYSGTAWTAARSLKVPIDIMVDFQNRYCRGDNAAYPGIPRYWAWVVEQLQTVQKITTPFGRTRHFFGRPNDETTWREAIAFVPQSTTADRMNLGLWRVWRYVPEVQLLAQTYDSITFQIPEWLDVNAIIQKILKLIEVELVAPNGRKYIVPGEAKQGWNWGYYDQVRNPEGLRKVGPEGDSRVRRYGFDRFVAEDNPRSRERGNNNSSLSAGDAFWPRTLSRMFFSRLPGGFEHPRSFRFGERSVLSRGASNAGSG